MYKTIQSVSNACGHCGQPEDDIAAKFCGNCGIAKQPAPGYRPPNLIETPYSGTFSAPTPYQNGPITNQPYGTAMTNQMPGGPTTHQSFNGPITQQPYGAPITQPLPAQAGLVSQHLAGTLESWQKNIPEFAQVHVGAGGQVSKELQMEAGKLMILLARERLFLYAQWIFFIGLNLCGCWLALKCYYEFIGDEMSKMMIASTPFLFINSCALMCIIPIKGTRKEISRLTERLSYVRFKIDFGHLM